MAYKESLFDKISSKLYRPMRTLGDLNIKLLGTKVSVLRIIKGKMNFIGEIEEELEMDVLSNVQLRYPSEMIEIFQKRGTQKVDIKAFDMNEFLPIEMTIQWGGKYNEDPVDLNEGDILVDCFFGKTEEEKMPVILVIEKLRAKSMGKYIIRKSAELSLYRGNVPANAQIKIDQYINSL